ncbi:MAG: DUF3142 domain-containing protein, partial [Kiritimatiellaeota bacterium]|nr:DUF3142 domain-containing protein [Kiritimatiellota bacterium]
PLYVLAGELERDTAGKWVWKRPDAPDDVWDDAVAVLRAPVDAMEDTASLLGVLSLEIARLKTTRVQLDVDVPERWLAAYGKLLGGLRAVFPSLELSATLLPAHLERAETAEVVKALDGFVLQVHGIEPPRHRDENYALMKREVALRAVERARALGRPFKIALPTYAYVLVFDGAGNFSRLYAEGFPGVAKGMEARVAAPDFTLLAEMLQMGLDVIWFRLPVANDRWALDMEAVRSLENGTLPRPRVVLASAREEGRLVIQACFQNQVALEPAEVEVRWKDAALRGEFFPLNGTKVDVPHGALPERITVQAQGCGQWFTVAFALTGNDLL